MDERYVSCATNKSKGYTNEWEELKTNRANAKERTTPPTCAGGESENVDKERGLRVFLFVAGSLSKW